MKEYLRGETKRVSHQIQNVKKLFRVPSDDSVTEAFLAKQMGNALLLKDIPVQRYKLWKWK